MAEIYDPLDRALEKERSRLEDERALESGEKSQEQLRAENGMFYGLEPIIRWDLTKRLY